MSLLVRGLLRHYGGVKALDGVSFEVPSGQCVALIGPNGAGKSTCFACLAGQQRPGAGEVVWRGQTLTALAPEARLALGVAHPGCGLPGGKFGGRLQREAAEAAGAEFMDHDLGRLVQVGLATAGKGAPAAGNGFQQLLVLHALDQFHLVAINQCLRVGGQEVGQQVQRHFLLVVAELNAVRHHHPVFPGGDLHL